MPTKWLQQRADGSKNGHGIGFEGPGVVCSGSEAGSYFKAHGLCVSLNFRLESNDEEEEEGRRHWYGTCIAFYRILWMIYWWVRIAPVRVSTLARHRFSAVSPRSAISFSLSVSSLELSDTKVYEP